MFVLAVIVAAIVSFATSFAAAKNLDHEIRLATKRTHTAWKGTSAQATFLAKSILGPTLLVTLSIALINLRLCVKDYPSWLSYVFGALVGICAVAVHYRILSKISNEDTKGEAWGKILYDFLVVGTFTASACCVLTNSRLDDHVRFISIGVILLLSGISFVHFVDLTIEKQSIRRKKARKTRRIKEDD